ncbi:MAG: putative bifunctional diguanylate cyclase/phosphodiesterase [Planctomycetota bacterium]|jgi:diguanylate cyclase (GGDEF)-like protein
MSDPLIEIFVAAVVVAVIVALIEIITGSLRPSARGWASILIGASLLGFGGLLSIDDDSEPPESATHVEPPESQQFRRDIVCFLGGALFVGTGLIRRLTPASGHDHLRRLNSALAQTSRELSAAQELLNSIVRSSISGVMILQAMRDQAGIVIDFECRHMNEEAEQLLGRSAAVLTGDSLLKHLACIKTEGLFHDAVSVIETKLPFKDERCCKLGGKDRWYQIVAVKHGDGIVVNFADVSNRKRTEDQLRHAAQHDTLTGTPNRSLFTERLEQAINRARRLPNYKFAVLFLDVDRFKIINDSLGHEVGDQLLISFSDRLRVNLRTLDTATRIGDGHLPARLGGDEFAILLDGIHDVRDAVLVADRLQKELSAPHTVGGHEVITTTSIGIVTSDGNYERPDDILRDADTAMYQAKKSGKARHVVFDEHMHSEVLQRLNLEKELRQAAEQDQFRLVYQPIVSLESASLEGFEALIRWAHPVRGIVPPAAFIELAEELGLIVPIGEWVLREACEQLSRWQKLRPGHPPLSMSVNLSKQQLTHPDLIPTITALIKRAGIEAGTLHLEITESTIMESADRLEPLLTQLQDVGVKLAMDDFGTGHSSLSFLHTVPMDILKIDRSFIDSAVKKRDCAAIVRTIVQLAHNLEMQVVAEGVETQEQLILLQNLDCNYAQGFLFDHPLDAQAAECLLSREYRFTIAA